MERMKCPECGAENPMRGVADETRKYVCRQCGMVYYTPDSCLTDPQEKPLDPEPSES
jgi:transcription initiation factor TFIIIB Brf1 subunit/transcription initiation factor TFIIB